MLYQPLLCCLLSVFSPSSQASTGGNVGTNIEVNLDGYKLAQLVTTARDIRKEDTVAQVTRKEITASPVTRKEITASPVTRKEDLAASMVTDNMVAPLDSYSMYGQLQDLEKQFSGSVYREVSVVKTLQAALATLMETALHGFFTGFVPAVERRRREAGDEERSYLDMAVTTLGALVGRKNCTQVIACRAGRLAAQKLPGAAVLVMMVENLVPPALRGWFGVVKEGVMSRDTDCVRDYKCTLVEEG